MFFPGGRRPARLTRAGRLQEWSQEGPRRALTVPRSTKLTIETLAQLCYKLVKTLWMRHYRKASLPNLTHEV